MAAVISRKLGLGGRLLAAANSVYVKVSGVRTAASKLADILVALHANNVALRTTVASLVTQFNQLRTDYNANANIVTDTTATAVTAPAALGTSVEDAS